MAVDTKYDTGDTYFGMNDYSSKPDHICTPQGLQGAVQSCRILREAGRRLQLIRAREPRDHYSMAVDLMYHTRAPEEVANESKMGS